MNTMNGDMIITPCIHWEIQKVIHPVAKEILGQLLAMERKLWKKSDSWESSQLEAELRKRKNICLIASAKEVNGGGASGTRSVLAYLLYTVNGLTLQILKILVLPEYRRRGIGKSLCNEALRFAREGRKAVAALHVYTENEPAIRLYWKLGFQKDGFIQARRVTMWFFTC